MTHTTRPQRTAVPSKPRRQAPRYPALPAGPLADLEHSERARYDLHRIVDNVCDVLARAELDADAVGFPDSYRARDGSRSTDEGALNAVELAAAHPDPAPDWVAHYRETVAHLHVLERTGMFHWPPPLAAGTVVTVNGETVTVGQRGNTVPVCAWCDQPAPSGRDPQGRTLARQIGERTVHAQPCYHQAYREAAKRAVSLPALLATPRKKAS